MAAALFVYWLITTPIIARSSDNGEGETEPSIASELLVAPPNLGYAATPSTPPPVHRATHHSTDELLEAIGSCEGGDNAHATNPNSTAKGRFQFLDGTWRHYASELWGADASLHHQFDWDDNTDLARYVIETYGTHDWDESAYCWRPKLSTPT